MCLLVKVEKGEVARLASSTSSSDHFAKYAGIK
jgi:hypothetical protein